MCVAGTEVYRWNANSRTVVGRLDVSKVIPTDDPDAGMVVEGDHISGGYYILLNVSEYYILLNVS